MVERMLGRRVLVTGAASGIGRACARLFHAEGARLILLDRDAAALHEVASSLSGSLEIVVDVPVATAEPIT